ncbi:transcriptional regulator family: Fungal Specific TF [Penicillium soppii]|uniref:transcriptional regulator family: Fungal Specific TF n=1 Tax=Penicillium soppii TaxID=69789 RepID=UPI002546AE53|nr:transcriptional regulator family: Fungal Specific TF [Penicillium soppii]KAJ5871716.1 transcriptional regulator family: Fungal Specific TF [Penicillium soppii]
MSFTHPHKRPEDQPRNKIRKGTRSCWECKHRKVRCNFTSDSDRSCRECLVRGIPCRSQDLPEPENPRESERLGFNDRLVRVESHLDIISTQTEAILKRLDNIGSSNHSELPMRVVDSSLIPATVTPAQENAPVLDLFNNKTLGFHQSETPNSTPYGTINRDLEKLRRDLMALIPSPHTLELISGASTGWWLLRMQFFQEYEEPFLPVSLNVLSKSHPAAIAKAVLWIALCLQ